MPNWVLYFFVIGTWGTSWIAIKWQLGTVNPIMSVAYRFVLAGTILLIYSLIRGHNLKLPRSDHLRIYLLSLFMFSINYMLIYETSSYLPSGLVSIVFSTFSFMNVFNSRIFLKQPISKNVLFATFMGFCGLVLIFLPEIRSFDISTGAIIGVALGIASAYVASLGNIISVLNQKKKSLPVLQTAAFGMLYGGITTMMFALATGASFNFEFTSRYIGSLAFLSLFASILTFLSYLTLLGRIGPSRAGYCVLAFPVVAVIMSIFLEDYELHTLDVVGMLLILIGNYLTMLKPKMFEEIDYSREMPPRPASSQ